MPRAKSQVQQPVIYETSAYQRITVTQHRWGFYGEPRYFRCWRLTRGSRGQCQWLVGFLVHLGVCSNIVAELQAVRYELPLASQEGFRNLICKLNAQVVLTLIKSADN